MDFDNEAPLNRIKGESIKANSALHDYWLMGGGRSLDKLMALYLHPTEPLLKAPPTTKINTLKTWSQKLLWQVRIKRQKEIDDAIALERFRERHMGADEVMARLADMGRADLSQFPKFEDIQELDGHPLSHTIKKYKVTKRKRKRDDAEIIRIEIELNDPQKALELIGKDHGRFKDRLDITTGDRPFTIDDLARATQELANWENDHEDSPSD